MSACPGAVPTSGNPFPRLGIIFKRMQPPTDERELIDRAREGDRDAIQMLYRRYAGRVLAVVRRLSADEDSAADCAQEAWVRALRSLPGFRGDSAFGTWIHRIAVNTALLARRSGRRRAGREEPLPPALEVAGTAAPTGDALLRRRLEAALTRVPDGMRQVLVLHDVEGLTHEEIGAMLGIAPGTSKSQLFKARAQMRLLLRPLAAGATNDEGAVCNT